MFFIIYHYHFILVKKNEFECLKLFYYKLIYLIKKLGNFQCNFNLFWNFVTFALTFEVALIIKLSYHVKTNSITVLHQLHIFSF